MAGCAIRTSFAGHPRVGDKASHALTFKPDHLSGAGHSRPVDGAARSRPFDQPIRPL
jgi:hypothetical protein